MNDERKRKRKAYRAQYYQEHKAEHKAYQIRYRAEHRAERNAYDAKYYADHRDKCIDYGVQYYAEHKDQKRAYDILYQAAHKDVKRAHNAKYQAEHEDELRVYRAAYRQTDTGRAAKAASGHNRRVSLAGAPLTAAAILEVKAEHGGICPYCNRQIAGGHIDHVVPVSKGGTNDRENLVWACAPCNMQKHDKGLIEFMMLRKGD